MERVRPCGEWQRNFYNPITKESLHPDFDSPHGPHYDYTRRGLLGRYRYYPDGRMEPKAEETRVLREFELGREALDHVRSRLSDGRALSQLLMALPIESGRVISWLPAQVDLAASSFKDGLVFRAARRHSRWPEELGGNDDWIQLFIAGFLTASGQRFAIFENAVLRAHDSHPPEDLLFTYGSDVFYFLTSKTVEKVAEALDWVDFGYFVRAILTEPKEALSISNRQEVSAQTLHALVDGTEAIIVDAFDAEAHIVWMRA